MLADPLIHCLQNKSMVDNSRIGIKIDLYFFTQDDPEIPFTEDDYRRRKPHPNFKEHISAEKTVIKLGKTVSNFYGYQNLLKPLPHNAAF